jgi:hypothetical protein
MKEVEFYHRSKVLGRLGSLSGYTPWSVLFRFSIVSVVSILLLIIGLHVSTDPNEIQQNINWVVYLKVAIVFNLLTEGNVLIDNVFERFYPIPKKIDLRVLANFLFSSLFGFFTLMYFKNQFADEAIMSRPIVQVMLTFGLFFFFIIIVISIGMRISNLWMTSEKEVEQLKRSKLKSDYNALQDQLNPHFLFNNLSVLKSMIKYDPDGALKFTQNFTDVYRYVLQSKDSLTISFEKELDFIKAFLDLHKERLGEGMLYDIDIDPKLMTRQIPPLALQLLVENAIKHNVSSKEKPLTIRIFSEDEEVLVVNNIQLKESTYSTKAGLENLKKRFEYVSRKGVEIKDDGQQFVVRFPLLTKNVEDVG